MHLIAATKGKITSLLHWFLTKSLLQKIIIIAILVSAFWFAGQQLLLGMQKQEMQYQTAEVEKGTLVTSVTASGTISSGNSASITSNATGIVKEVYVGNGSSVALGDPIALIVLDKNAQAQQSQSWASYLSAQNTLNSAKAKMNSLQAALFKANQDFITDAGTQTPNTNDPTYIIEKATWQQAEADYTNQEGVISQAEAALASASLSYAQLSATITSPMAGIVSNLNLTPGFSLSGSSTTNSTSTTNSNTSSSQIFGAITLPESMPQASLNLSEIDITKIAVGQKVTMTLDAFPDKTFTGKVTAINTNGAISSGVTTYPITITFDTSVDHMYPNMAVSATIITSVSNDVLLVPIGAVQTNNGESTALVMKDGKVSLLTVATGESNDTQIEVTSGLTEGETIVTEQRSSAVSKSTTGQGQTASPFGTSGFGGRGGPGAGFVGGGGQNRGNRTFQTR